MLLCLRKCKESVKLNRDHFLAKFQSLLLSFKAPYLHCWGKPTINSSFIADWTLEKFQSFTCTPSQHWGLCYGWLSTTFSGGSDTTKLSKHQNSLKTVDHCQKSCCLQNRLSNANKTHSRFGDVFAVASLHDSAHEGLNAAHLAHYHLVALVVARQVGQDACSARHHIDVVRGQELHQHV